ncbi:hydrolase [Vibrio sp. MACH09]|uniref:Cof-type HAD-IIB family hydrolase n=1 Tax=unclassified Vibrio TaxID=2614977 RepID=UPI0014938F45|nr:MULTISPECIES: Cof-type HAD-IIB family hydrolase [unclassified Vibrio]NOI68441.1 Cof-type HAD-IIB family hydrolase [Vibrio sp. 99-8-1]GLO62297.1 hydrolase [Vibrio sp. MACH09]
MSKDSHSHFTIVASDLDGTLLSPDHQLSEVSKQTLKALHQQGYHFVFATGRHHIDVANMREQVGIPAYMITSNGARVHDVNDQLMYSKDIESDLVQPILDLVKHDSDLRINLYHNDQWLINQEDKLLKEFHKESKFSYSLFDIDHAPEQGIAKIFLIHTDHDHLAKYETKINEKFSEVTSVAFSTPNCLEIMGKSVSKGAALDAVAQTLGFTLQQCIAFGDGMNDAEMLSMAGKGLVMETAHEKVKRALPNNTVIGSNADNAVAHYLNSNLL